MIPGFEEGIVGMKKGETKDVSVTFPESYRNSELAGQDAVFQITVQSFKRPPELTDDWVAANTDYKTIDEYKASVRAQLEQEAQDQADSSLRSTAWNTVYTNSEVVEYPEKDVEEAVKTFKKQAEAYAKQGNMELEDFVESQGVSMDDFEAQCQQYAQYPQCSHAGVPLLLLIVPDPERRRPGPAAADHPPPAPEFPAGRPGSSDETPAETPWWCGTAGAVPAPANGRIPR